MDPALAERVVRDAAAAGARRGDPLDDGRAAPLERPRPARGPLRRARALAQRHDERDLPGARRGGVGGAARAGRVGREGLLERRHPGDRRGGDARARPRPGRRGGADLRGDPRRARAARAPLPALVPGDRAGGERGRARRDRAARRVARGRAGEGEPAPDQVPRARGAVAPAQRRGDPALERGGGGDARARRTRPGSPRARRSCSRTSSPLPEDPAARAAARTVPVRRAGGVDPRRRAGSRPAPTRRRRAGSSASFGSAAERPLRGALGGRARSGGSWTGGRRTRFAGPVRSGGRAGRESQRFPERHRSSSRSRSRLTTTTTTTTT